MSGTVDHVEGQTFHGRKGTVRNAFRYGVDYVMLDAEVEGEAPRWFSRNRGNVLSVQDRDHGGAPGEGRGADWVRERTTSWKTPPPSASCDSRTPGGHRAGCIRA